MGSLSNLYISQSYQSLIHLGTNNTASANLIELQDGLGNSIGVAVNTNGDLFLSGSLTASLQQGYLYVGGASGKTTAFATSSLVTNINTGSLVTTSSFNSYTQSTNIRLNNLETTSASVNVSISNLNSTTASQGVSITNLNASSASQQISIDALNTNSASVNTSISALNTFTASQSTASLVTSITNLNTFSASALVSISNLNASSASQQISIDALNTNSASVNTSITNINSATSSLFTSASLALVTASFDTGTRNLTFTKGNTTQFSVNIPDVSGSAGNFVTTSSFNAYTQSNDQRVSSLETNSASVNISVSNINTFTQSANISINALNAATSSYATSAITASSLVTASVSLNTITFTKGDGTTFPITVNTGSGGGGGTTDTGSLMVTGSIAGNILTFTKGDASTFNLTIPSATGSVFDTGSFATTGSNSFNGDQNVTGSIKFSGQLQVGSLAIGPTIQSLDSGTPLGNTSLQVNAGTSGSFSLRTLYGAGVGKAILEAYDTFPGFTKGGKIEALSNGGLNLIGYAGNITSTAPLASVIVDNSFVIARQGNLQGGVYMNTNSGSLVLTPSGFSATSGSLLHLSASSNTNFVNLIFKNNNNTADTIISGSNNIFTNATAPTAGFKRYIGGSSNLMLAPGAINQISGSQGNSISTNFNIHMNASIISRGPVSASAWTAQNNMLIGGINIGSSAANNAEKILGSLTINANQVGNSLSIIANRTAISASTSITNNALIGGATSLTMASSSIAYQTNVGNASITNGFQNAGGASTNNSLQVITNWFGGAYINVSGSDAGGLTNPRYIGGNYLFNGFALSNTNIANLSLNGSGSSMLSTMMMGQDLGITGSNGYDSNNNILTPGIGAGSAFFGRWNSQSGNRARTAETVFAIGTGTSTSLTKTGFLIDSGSNTYVEGTFNVSGSTTLSGSLYIQSGSTLPSATGSSILTWNPTTGQVSQSPIATLISSSFSVGAFNSTITQSGSAAVSQSMTFNNTDISNGVSIVSNSQITLANTGTYNIQFSAQVLAATGQDDVYIWLKKNGTNVANTGTKLVLANNEADVAAWNFVITAAASDYFELAWQSRDGHTLLSAATATGNIPGIPSIILTVTQVE